MMKMVLLMMYPKEEQMMRNLLPWRSDQGPANKAYIIQGMAWTERENKPFQSLSSQHLQDSTVGLKL